MPGSADLHRGPHKLDQRPCRAEQGFSRTRGNDREGAAHSDLLLGLREKGLELV